MAENQEQERKVLPSPFGQKSRTMALGEAVGEALQPTQPSPFGTTGLAGVAQPGSPAMGMILGETFEERNRADDGTPFDTSYEVPFDLKAGAAFRRDPNLKVKWLNEQVGNDFTRLSKDTGEPIIRILDPETGQAKDVLVNTHDLTPSDIAEYLGLIPEISGGAWGMRAGKAIGAKLGEKVLKSASQAGPIMEKVGQVAGRALQAERGPSSLLRTITSQAAGSETGGGIKDVSMEALQGEAPRFGAIARERAGMMPFDMLADVGLAGAAKVARKVITPIGHSASPMNQQAMGAQRWILQETGENLPIPLSMRTGHPGIAMGESLLARHPFASPTMQRQLEQMRSGIERLTSRLLGLGEGAGARERLALADSISDQKVGQELVGAIGERVNPAKEAIENRKQLIRQEATRQIEEDIATSTVPGRPLHAFKVGEALRSEVGGKFSELQQWSQEQYQEILYKKLGGGQRDFTVPSLPDRARKAIGALPKKTVTRTLEGDEIQVQVPFEEFIQPEVLRKLRGLALNDPQHKYSLEDLISLRGNVDDSISESSIRMGKKDARLLNIRNILTESIEEASKQKPGLHEAWKGINQEYSKRIGKFDPDIVDTLLAKKGAGGYLNDEDITNRIITGLGGQKSASQDYLQLKEFLGEQSPAFKGLKRAVGDFLFDRSLEPTTTLVNGKALLENLTQMQRYNPAVVNDVFGKMTQEEMRGIGLLLDTIGNDAKLDASKISSLLSGTRAPGKLVSEFRKLVDEQKKLDKLYRSERMKEIGEKRFAEGDFNVSEFVDRMLYKTGPDEMREILGQLSDKKDILAKLQTKTIEKILFDTQRNMTRTDPARLGRGDPFRRPAGQALEQALGDEARRETIELLIGQRPFKMLQALGQYARGAEATDVAFASGAGITGAAQMADLFQSGPLEKAPAWLKMKLYALMITNPRIGRLLSNNALPPEKLPAFTMAVLSTQPVLEATLDNWVIGEAEALMSQAGEHLWKKAGELYFSKPEEKKPMPSAVAPMTPQQMAIPTNETRKVQGQTPQGALTP